MTSEKPFNVIEEGILDHLATYQFLTHKQLMALSVNNDPKRVYAGLASLRARRPKVVFHIEFGTNPRDGNLAAMYALTARGAALIVERYRGAITVPVHKRVDTFKNDYWHRLWCVDFHITVRHWAAAHDQSIGLFDTYYDPTTGGGRGKKLEKKTRIPYQGRWFEPDAIFQLIDRAGKSRLFVYELYVGIRTKRVEEQLRAHLTAMGEEAVEAAYGATSSARHLISEIPAVTHVDYSARAQTVHEATNPRYWRLIQAFKQRTGCPVVVNTSFNVRGEPIVCTPEDAFRCFMGSEIEILVVGNCWLRKEAQDPGLRRDYKEAFELD